jgi:hypothetical protein
MTIGSVDPSIGAEMEEIPSICTRISDFTLIVDRKNIPSTSFML